MHMLLMTSAYQTCALKARHHGEWGYTLWNPIIKKNPIIPTPVKPCRPPHARQAAGQRVSPRWLGRPPAPRAVLAALMVPRSAARVHGRYERYIDCELCPVPKRQTVPQNGPGTTIGEVEDPEQRVGDHASPGLALKRTPAAAQ